MNVRLRMEFVSQGTGVIIGKHRDNLIDIYRQLSVNSNLKRQLPITRTYQ